METNQGCQIFHGAWYQNPKKCTKWTQNVPNGHKNVCKIFRMAVKYINNIQSKALPNFPKFGFFVWKQTIWQPWNELGLAGWSDRDGRKSFQEIRKSRVLKIRPSFNQCIIQFQFLLFGTFFGQ
jgi:hypothetical protein